MPESQRGDTWAKPATLVLRADDSKVRIVERVIITGHATLAEVARYTKAAEPL